MFKNSFIKAFLVLGILTAGILVVAATRAHTKATTDEEVCSEAADQCDKAKAHGEFIILEALNRAVMATAR